MEVIATATVVMAITFVVLAGFMIRTLIEIRRSAVAVRRHLEEVQSHLQSVLKEMKELTANLTLLTAGIASKTDEVKCFMTAIGDTGRSISRINVVLGEVAGLLTRSSLWITGLKAAGRYVMHRIASKRR